MSRDPGQVEAAFDAAERAGRLLSEAFMYRHNPQTKRLVELVAEGAIGELRLVRAAFSYSLFLDDPWHCRTPVIELRREGGAERIALAPEDSYRIELENVSAAIRGEADLLLGRADAVAQARALEALHRSADAGTPVPL